MTATERVLGRTLLWMTVGSAAAIPALVLPAPDDPLLTATIHLSLLVAFSVALAFHLAPLADPPWFEGMGASARVRRALSWAVIVVAVTGATGLVTLATSAALRYDASMQFLQLLSALDIGWAATALALGARRRFGSGAAVGLVGVLGVVCVWAIWRYLDTVGFGPNGAWVVSASDLATLVLPYDMGAALLAVTVFTLGVSHPTAQASDQS